MNKQQREPFLLLTTIDLPEPFSGRMGLCHFCRYAQWYGGSSSCSGESDAELECLHPIWAISDGDHPFDVWAGADCWGFRPLHERGVCVDIVGIYLQGKWPDIDTIPELAIKKRTVP